METEVRDLEGSVVGEIRVRRVRKVCSGVGQVGERRRAVMRGGIVAISVVCSGMLVFWLIS